MPGLRTALHVTNDDVEAEIVSEVYFTAEDGVVGAFERVKANGEEPYNPSAEELDLDMVMFCVLITRNGFMVTGESICNNPDNFNEEVGRQIAYRHAVGKLRAFLGFAMKDACYMGRNTAPPRYRYRCSESGEYVTRAYAQAHPRTTVRESNEC